MLQLNTGWIRPSCGENAIAITTTIAKSVRKGPFTAFPSWASEQALLSLFLSRAIST